MSVAVLGMWQPPFREYIRCIPLSQAHHFEQRRSRRYPMLPVGVFNTPEGFHNLASGEIERVCLDPATLALISEGPRMMPEVVSSCIIIPIAHPMACDEFPKPFGAHLEESICDRMSTTLPSGVVCTSGSPSAPPDRILLRCFINILLDLWSQNSILEVAYEFHLQLADNGKNGMKMREVRVDSRGYYTLELMPKLEMTLENDLDNGV
ncbi:hypothetical protein EDC04DRAFT_2610981 [Pisolithus marmoratus]|nr:hypothetical protein EDC04DRAFT_2610981 [Pisolithus marmoratus]